MAEAPGGARPLGEEDFAAALHASLGAAPRGLVLAVSGGPDSVCLMGMTARLLALTALPPVTVATVDHGLRAGSRAEAEAVVAAAMALGLPARILAWSGPKPARAIQEKARDARRALLSDACRSVGADHLVTAHTRDDQAETVLFRLLRGSGPAGLAGMRLRSALGADLTQARPFLQFDKARLVATCERYGWRYATDPSNVDPRFARSRLRGLMPRLAAEGLDAAALERLGARAARAEDALAAATADLARTALRQPAPGCVELDMRPMASLPDEIATRLIGRAVASVGGSRPVRLDRLERASAVLRQAAVARRAAALTLHGTLLRLTCDGLLMVRREKPRHRGAACAEASQEVVKHNETPSLGKGGHGPYIAN